MNKITSYEQKLLLEKIYSNLMNVFLNEELESNSLCIRVCYKYCLIIGLLANEAKSLLLMFFIPRIDDMLDELAGAQCLIKVDLRSGIKFG